MGKFSYLSFEKIKASGLSKIDNIMSGRIESLSTACSSIDLTDGSCLGRDSDSKDSGSTHN